MNKICEFLHLPYNKAMEDPYSGTAAKLTGAGDPNWVFRQQIEPNLATAWQQRRSPQQLGPLAAKLGYTI
jgi:hypothetical protein